MSPLAPLAHAHGGSSGEHVRRPYTTRYAYTQYAYRTFYNIHVPYTRTLNERYTCVRPRVIVPGPLLLSYAVICIRLYCSASLDDRHAARGRRESVRTLGHNVSLLRDSQVARAPPFGSAHTRPCNGLRLWSRCTCMRMLARLRSSPEEPPWPLTGSCTQGWPSIDDREVV